MGATDIPSGQARCKAMYTFAIKPLLYVRVIHAVCGADVLVLKTISVGLDLVFRCLAIKETMVTQKYVPPTMTPPPLKTDLIRECVN